MPYIKQEKRDCLFPFLENLFAQIEGISEQKNEGDLDLEFKTGDLNYCITRLIHFYLRDKPNYEKYNSAIGILECAKLELYRRKVGPYEDEAINKNGDL